MIRTPKRGIAMTTPARIDRLKAKKEEIEKRLAELEARERNKNRKEETRLKILIGGGIVADAKIHPEVIDLIQEILDRATPAARDRNFLKKMGWLPKEAVAGQ